MLLVTGGETANRDLLSTTEVATYNTGVLVWREVGGIPLPQRYLRADSLSNTVYLSGGENKEDSRSVLVWLPSAETFIEIGTLSHGRYHHASIAIKDPFALSVHCL